MKFPALASRRAPDGGAALGIGAALRASPFPAKAWHLAVVVLRLNEGERRVVLRDVFARELRANDLEASALECTRRKVRPGEALVWAEIELTGLAHAGFSIVRVGPR